MLMIKGDEGLRSASPKGYLDAGNVPGIFHDLRPTKTMWIFTSIGFFSAVQKPGTNFLTIRARVKADLDQLREKYLPELSPSVGHVGSDYPWRATATHPQFAAALVKIACDVQYANFKDEVSKQQGKARALRYHKVWSALYDMEDEGPSTEQANPWAKAITGGKKVAYGGVVFDPQGRVLLREPKNHFDGYVWTFPKGRPDPGESPESTALRETCEETGVAATIVCPIPGEFVGGTTINRYYLMQAPAGSGSVPATDPETQSICWVTSEEAAGLIKMTINATGRERDLKVLKSALTERDKRG